MKIYNNFFKIAEYFQEIQNFPLPTIDESLKFASNQILEGFSDESEVLYEIEIMEDNNNIRYTGFGFEFNSSDLRAAIDLNNKFNWNLIKR